MQRLRTLLLLAPLGLVLVPAPARASSTGNMPWDNILTILKDSSVGTITSALVTIAIVAGGLYWAFTDNQRGLLKVLKALIAAGIITGIPAFMSSFGIGLATL